MQGYDIVMLGVMAIAIFRGYSKGLAWQISSIASIVISYYIAYRFKDRVATVIDMPDPWNGLVAMMLLFVGSSLVIWFMFQSIRGAIEKAKLKDFDQQLGAIFGGIKGAVWCTVITLVALSFLQPQMSQQIVKSRSGGYIARLIASSKTIIPREIQQVIQPYIQRAEDQLQDRAEVGTPPSDTTAEEDPGAIDDWYDESNRGADPLTELSKTDDDWR
jgi:membrane protein required for colicin V production